MPKEQRKTQQKTPTIKTTGTDKHGTWNYILIGQDNNYTNPWRLIKVYRKQT